MYTFLDRAQHSGCRKVQADIFTGLDFFFEILHRGEERKSSHIIKETVLILSHKEDKWSNWNKTKLFVLILFKYSSPFVH